MFDKNILTFNPGWDQQSQDLDSFTDVRELQRELRQRGVELIREADEASEGPASITLLDPDGNPVLIDQHRNARSAFSRPWRLPAAACQARRRQRGRSALPCTPPSHR